MTVERPHWTVPSTLNPGQQQQQQQQLEASALAAKVKAIGKRSHGSISVCFELVELGLHELLDVAKTFSTNGGELWLLHNDVFSRDIRRLCYFLVAIRLGPDGPGLAQKAVAAAEKRDREGINEALRKEEEVRQQVEGYTDPPPQYTPPTK
ncbi:hypothetical protein FJTKL_15366 [Diaporthe vaccinii]|uniref:Uncharacterized protein n=1 Tax=Diaporthe vaccinii TaxID=105482 RepID=A0ABR4E529_9PEZI